MNFSVRLMFSKQPLLAIFEREDLLEVGIEAAKLTRDRIDRADHVSGGSKAPLSPSYRERKIKAGGKPIRNLRLSGQLLFDLKAWGSTKTKVSVGWQSERGKLLASVHGEPEGLDAVDRRTIAALFQRLLAKRAPTLRFFR